ncbi:MAG: hypothetical protein WC635_12840 [Bacteriovorax sp.]|jgi:hypothetical protein
MKIKALFFALVLILSTTLMAETVRFKAPAINGKLIANNIKLTDWQTVMSCHFNHRGQRKESIRYPQTFLTSQDGGNYSLKIKAGSLSELLPNWELQTCAYKLILIGKNITSHQLAFGEIFLLGKETGVMSTSELQIMQDLNQVTKILNEKTRELIITNGKDGGIVEDI